MEDDVTNNIDNILEAGYHQSHYLIKDNIENKQMNETEEFSETRNHNNPIIRSYRKQHPHNIHPH